MTIFHVALDTLTFGAFQYFQNNVSVLINLNIFTVFHMKSCAKQHIILSHS